MTFNNFLILSSVILIILMIPAIWRLIVGPNTIDRIMAVNIIGTKTAILLVIIGTLYNRVGMFVDFALSYALLNFTGAIAVAKFIKKQNNNN